MNNLTNFPKTAFVFDVESIGLHGEAFAVGYCQVLLGTENLVKVSEGTLWFDPNDAEGSDSNREWIRDNVPDLPYSSKCRNAREFRDKFWNVLRQAMEAKSMIVADCNWPVESNFLSRCIKDDPINREWEGPYPLYDLVSMMLCNNVDPLETKPRIDSEMPPHHPLMDARQSARQLNDLYMDIVLHRELMQPEVLSDGGPWAIHNMPCCVHSQEKAVLNLNSGVFGPSWKAQREGYRLIKIDPRSHFVKWIVERFLVI